MRERNQKHLPTIGSLAAALIALASHPAAGQLNLGPEQIVQANGIDIVVPGYSVPSFALWDDDDRPDLIIGEGSGTDPGKVRVYRNVGTRSSPLFSGYLYAQSGGTDLTCTGSGCMGCFPRLAYRDADARKDLVVGQADGTVKHFPNNGTDADPAFDAGTFLQVGTPGAKTNINVGARATPSMLDWNNDGRKDLVAGAYDGRIHIFLNEGTDTDPDFRAETFAQTGGGSLTVPSGRSSPVMCDLDSDGKKDLLTGNTNGQLLFYRNTGTDAAPLFSGYESVKAAGIAIDLPGTPRSRPFVGDWTGDSFPDVLIGAGDGKLHLYQSVPEPTTLAPLALAALCLIRLPRHSRRRNQQ